MHNLYSEQSSSPTKTRWPHHQGAMNEWMKKKMREFWSINHIHNCDSIRPRTNHFMPTHRFQFSDWTKALFIPFQVYRKCQKLLDVLFFFRGRSDWNWTLKMGEKFINSANEAKFQFTFSRGDDFICHKSHETEEQDLNENKRD